MPDSRKRSDRILSWLIAFLAISAAYLYTFPQANIFYAVMVLLHAAGGVLATILLVPMLFRLLRSGTLATRAGWLLIAAGAVVGLILIKTGTPRTEWNKLYFHIALSLAGLALLIALFPLLAIVWLALKITSPGQPAIVASVCVGFNHIPFSRFRFQDRTGFGRWIESIGLSGLPQLLNVVRGEMALVGPEPDRVEFAVAMSERIPFYTHRLGAKPGLTGWAQVRYGYGATLAEAREKLEYDLYYIKHMSFGLDLLIMFETIKTILRRRGAQ